MTQTSYNCNELHALPEADIGYELREDRYVGREFREENHGYVAEGYDPAIDQMVGALTDVGRQSYDIGRPSLDFDVEVNNSPNGSTTFLIQPSPGTAVASSLRDSTRGQDAGDPFLPQRYHPVTIHDEDVDPYLVSFGPEDMRHPHNWSALKKWTIIMVVCSAAVCVTVASSIQASTYSNLEDEFGVPRIEAVLGVSLYVLGFGIGARELSIPNVGPPG